jgi:dynein heavy chain
MYNAVQTQLLPVERPLMKASVDKVEAALRPGLQTLNWKSHGIDMFVTEAMVAVKTTNTLMESLSTNLKGIQKALDQFAKEPVFARRAKAVSCDEFDKIIKDVVVVRTAEIEERGRAIKNHLRNMARDLKVSAGQADWKYYVDFVNNIVVAGLVKAALRSLVYINEQVCVGIAARVCGLRALPFNMLCVRAAGP